MVKITPVKITPKKISPEKTKKGTLVKITH